MRIMTRETTADYEEYEPFEAFSEILEAELQFGKFRLELGYAGFERRRTGLLREYGLVID